MSPACMCFDCPDSDSIALGFVTRQGTVNVTCHWDWRGNWRMGCTGWCHASVRNYGNRNRSDFCLTFPPRGGIMRQLGKR
jgi:hypothetical protein